MLEFVELESMPLRGSFSLTLRACANSLVSCAKSGAWKNRNKTPIRKCSAAAVTISDCEDDTNDTVFTCDVSENNLIRKHTLVLLVIMMMINTITMMIVTVTTTHYNQ